MFQSITYFFRVLFGFLRKPKFSISPIDDTSPPQTGWDGNRIVSLKIPENHLIAYAGDPAVSSCSGTVKIILPESCRHKGTNPYGPEHWPDDGTLNYVWIYYPKEKVSPSADLLETAKNCRDIEAFYRDLESAIPSSGPSTQVHLAVTARALLEVIDKALEEGVIDRDDARLPAEFDSILSEVYAYLGDPL